MSGSPVHAADVRGARHVLRAYSLSRAYALPAASLRSAYALSAPCMRSAYALSPAELRTAAVPGKSPGKNIQRGL